MQRQGENNIRRKFKRWRDDTGRDSDEAFVRHGLLHGARTDKALRQDRLDLVPFTGTEAADNWQKGEESLETPYFGCLFSCLGFNRNFIRGRYCDV